MDNSDDIGRDFDRANELHVLAAAIDQINHRLAALEMNIDLILQELRQQRGASTPVPRAVEPVSDVATRWMTGLASTCGDRRKYGVGR